MSTWNTIQETPNQSAASIVFTAGATITINAPAPKVFGIITDHNNYEKWSTWTPRLSLEDDKDINVGSRGRLTVTMADQAKTYEIPLTIIECSPDTSGSGPFALAWRGAFLPSWFGVAERVQTVKTKEDGQTEVMSWESMSGWGVYVLDFFLGVKKELTQSNLKYLQDLKAFAEQ